MSNILDLDKTKCVGCMCCVNKCPKKCISVTEDKEGFIVPLVEQSKCVNCSICYKSCQINNKVDKNFPLKAFAIQSKIKNDLKNSSSGGVAFEISKQVILKGGVVYGAVFTKELQVKHYRATNIEDLKLLQGSKYVQSDITGVYSNIEKDCLNGRVVLFIGTPCQVAAVKLFFSKDFKNLFFIDLICHGVPNQRLFNKYINWKENKIKDRVKKYSFRDKDEGWGTNVKIITNTGKVIKGHAHTEPYYSDFEDAFNYRESCYSCKYATIERVGDATIGDFWGIKEIKNMKKTNGISCALINTHKGNMLIDSINNDCFIEEASIEEIAKNNSSLKKPAQRNKIRDNYYSEIEKKGINYSQKLLYRKKSFYKKKIANCLPKKLKKILKG